MSESSDDGNTPDRPPAGAGRRRSGPVKALVSTFGAAVAPIQEFFRLEAASGILLFTAAVAALTWANSPLADSYRSLFETVVVIGVADSAVRVSVHDILNEGLMTLFFFVVGMEIKRELVGGELRTLRRALLPAIAAVGGMVVPSAIFLIFNWGKPGQAGWGIPMATDIAFAIGCLKLLGKRVPHPLLVFLTALAIFDDIGGILVIALFYGHGVSVPWLVGAAGVLLLLIGMNRLHVRSGIAYLVVGFALWYAFHHGGIHATIAGVAVGLLIPATPSRSPREVLSELGDHCRGLVAATRDREVDEGAILQIEEKLEDMESPLQRFIHALHPWVAFVIMPLFALANSGVRFSGMSPSAVGGPVALGIALGLLLGKPLGIMAATAVAVKAGLAELPGGRWLRVLGISVIAGIGFTVALFIGALAYPSDPTVLDQAKIGILIGSLVAGCVGFLILRLQDVPAEPGKAS